MLPYRVLPIHGNASLGYYYVNINEKDNKKLRRRYLPWELMFKQ